jgi:hypothetical protein
MHILPSRVLIFACLLAAEAILNDPLASPSHRALIALFPSMTKGSRAVAGKSDGT